MQVAEHPQVIELPPNTPRQAAALAKRHLVLTPGARPEAVRIASAAPEGSPSRPLQAPWGGFRELAADGDNLVAVHLHDSGRIEAFGPFSCDEEAYDYFPDHSSPHDTLVAVFAVAAEPNVN